MLPEGETILMTAARTGRAEALMRCSSTAAPTLDAREKWYGETALHLGGGREPRRRRRACCSSAAPTSNVRSAPLDLPRRRTGQSVLPLGSWTPLMYAARENALDAGRALVAAQAPTSTLTDPDGATALVIAIINANYDFAALLLDAGADPNVVDKDAAWGRSTPAIDMHRLAVGHGRPNPQPSGTLDAVDIVRRLLEQQGRSRTRG